MVFFFVQREQIASLAARHRTPVIYPWREYVDASGLMSYGPNLAESYRMSGTYAGRILKGEKPADLPIIRPTSFEFVINSNVEKNIYWTQ